MAKILRFELDYNEANRKAVARIIGKRRLATEQEVRDCVNGMIGDALMDALMGHEAGRRR